MTDTLIEPDGYGSYTIKQPFINGNHINPKNITTVLEEFHDLLKAHVNSIHDNGK